MSAAVVIPLDADFDTRADAALRLWRIATGRPRVRPPDRLTRHRRHRLAVTLRALDARLADQSYRSIAKTYSAARVFRPAPPGRHTSCATAPSDWRAPAWIRCRRLSRSAAISAISTRVVFTLGGGENSTSYLHHPPTPCFFAIVAFDLRGCLAAAAKTTEVRSCPIHWPACRHAFCGRPKQPVSLASPAAPSRSIGPTARVPIPQDRRPRRLRARRSDGLGRSRRQELDLRPRRRDRFPGQANSWTGMGRSHRA